MKNNEMKTVWDYAQYYKKLGWVVVPVVRGTKRPAVNWKAYQEIPPTEQQLQKWFYGKDDVGIALVTGKLSGVVVVDKDSYKSNGIELDLPTPFIVKTGANGEHGFFAAIDDVKNSVNAEIAIDVRGQGGISVLPPTIHPNGNRYEWIGNLPKDKKDLPPLPATLLSKVTTERKAKEKLNTSELISVEEGGRDDSMLRLTNSFLARGMDQDEAWFAVNEINRTYKPPLSDEDMKRIFNQSFNFIAQQGKYMRDRSFEKRVHSPLITIDEILSLPDTVDNWLVEPFVLAQGITIISGLPNHFKSLFTQLLVKAVASGKPFLDKFSTHQASVLIVDREIPKQRLKTRWSSIGDVKDLPILFYPYSDSFKLDNPSDMNHLKKVILENNIKLLVIDTFNRSHTGRDLSSPGAVAQLFEPLKELLEQTAVIVLHHSSKKGYASEKPTPDELLGSVDFIAEIDLLFTLRKKDKNTLIVHPLKARDSEIPDPFEVTVSTFQDSHIDMMYEGEVLQEETTLQKRERDILELLGTGRKRKSEILQRMQMLGGKEGTVNNTLTILRGKKLIGSEHVGKEVEYFLTIDEKDVSLLPDTTVSGKQGNVLEVEISEGGLVDL